MTGTILVFLAGIMIGSFLNVCVYRLPREEQIVRGRSKCPHCEKQIAWYDNIPLVSYVILLGKCRQCRKPITFRYFVTELLNGLLWAAFWKVYGPSVICGIGWVFISLLLTAAMTDFETQLIPDEITIPGMVLGGISSLIAPELFETPVRSAAFLKSLMGWGTGGLVLLVLGLAGNKLFKREETMGGGDVKLLAMMGAFLGFQKVLLVFFAAPFLALPAGIYVKWLKKDAKSDMISFGPFLAAAGVWAFVYGDWFLNSLFYFESWSPLSTV